MIVVGIITTDRARDMTPSVPRRAWRCAVDRAGRGSGQIFLLHRRRALADGRSQLSNPSLSRAGRSFLRRLVRSLYALNHPDVFNGYVAISPSLWWDDQGLVKASPPFFAAHRDLRADIYIAMGDEGQEMLGGAWKLSALLEESKLTNLRWQFKRFPEEDHRTISYLATYEGLEAIFKGFRIADPVALFEQGGLAAFDRHYAKVSKRMGYTIAVPIEAYAGMVWGLSGRGRFAEAEEIGRKMLERDPKNTDTLSMLAGVAGMQKDNARAIGYLTQVLRLDPGNARARAALANYKVDVDKIVPR